VFFFICVNQLPAQIKNIGIPSLANYARKEYGASTQNWDISQDNRGIMYFANNAGLLTYDGSFWEIYTVPNNSIIRSVTVGRRGRIYVGAFDEFGYFFPDNKGQLVYHSLSELISPKDHDFGEIWKIHMTDHGVYFQSFTDLLVYRDGKVQYVISDRNLGLSFYVNGKLLIYEQDKGLFELNDDSLQYIPGSEVFINKEIWSVLPVNRNAFLICTAEHGIYNWSKNNFEYWKTEASEFCKKNQVYSGTEVDEKHYAIGSIQDGLIVINENGDILQHLNKDIGIQNNTVLSTFSDMDNNLWLGLDNGIDYVKISSPVSFYGKKKEIGAGYTSIIHKNKVYLGTNQGLFCKTWENIDKFTCHFNFKLVEGTRGQVWALKIIEGKLYCGHNKGAFLIDDEESKLLTSKAGVWDFWNVPGHPGKIIAGTYTSLLLFKKRPGREMQFLKTIQGFSESSREMAFHRGVLWMTHGYKGVYKIIFNETFDKVVDYELYGEKHGFPTDFGITVHTFKNELIFSTDNGFYYYDAEVDSFYEHSYLINLIGREKVNKKFYEDQSGNIWFFQGGELKILRLKYDGSYELEKIPFLELKETFIYSFEDLYIHDNTNIFIGTEDGFIHFDPSIIKYHKPESKTLIRKITTREDSIIFGGNFVNQDSSVLPDRPTFQIQYIDYEYNDLQFSYSSPDYRSLSNISYQVFLDGYDKEWSEFFDHTTKEYTNLSEGSYIFHVRSKNLLEELSPVSTFEFVIFPPWYRSTWAYVVYSIIIVVVGYLISKHYLKRFEEEKQRLEQKQKDELEKQKQQHKAKVILAEQEIVRLRNEKLELEVERNKAELENKSKELASIAMQITYKNEILDQVKSKLSRVAHKMIHEDSRNQVKQLIQTIESEMHKEDDWERFELHFDQVHENFIHTLKNEYPDLTPKDLKLAAYLRMNLSTKEIAPLLNISVRGVEISRYRLRKKLNLQREDNITDFLLNM
jgi:DNA-binding CsgD family transcriptional regulator